METGQWVMGHSQWPIDPWWNNSIPLPGYLLLFSSTAGHYLAYFLFLADNKKMLTHSIRPIIIAGCLIVIHDFLLSRPRGLSSTTMPRPLLVPCVGWNDVIAMGHESCGSWVNCVMGHMGHGSRKMTHFHLCLGIFGPWENWFQEQQEEEQLYWFFGTRLVGQEGFLYLLLRFLKTLKNNIWKCSPEVEPFECFLVCISSWLLWVWLSVVVRLISWETPHRKYKLIILTPYGLSDEPLHTKQFSELNCVKCVVVRHSQAVKC